MTILPYPKEYALQEGAFTLRGCTVATAVGMDYRVVRAAVELRAQITEKTGGFHTYCQFETASDGMITVAIDGMLGAEAYTLTVTLDRITIIGGDSAGCFYGLMTLKQLVEQSTGTIPAMTVSDAPDMRYRGFYHDATRGRVPTLASMKELVDLLASFKANSFQLYVEHVFDFAEFSSAPRSEEDYLTAEELLELDAYCYDRFIDFVPSLSTFGHLFELLTHKEYRELCELENAPPGGLRWFDRMAHHTINPSDERSIGVICSLIDQYLPLFRSGYFNICCDETFDLGKGRNAGKDAGALYLDFVSKISAHVRASGKTVMMWGDILLHHPEIIGKLPKDTVLLNWNYSHEARRDHTDLFEKSGYTQVVCPGNWSWDRLVEDINWSEPNITRMARFGYENRCEGILNTNWGDFGHIAPLGSCLYGMLLGCAVGWNIYHTDLDEAYERAASRLLYGVEDNLIPMLRELGRATMTAYWREFAWYSVSGNSADLRGDPDVLISTAERCSSIYAELCAYPDRDGKLESLKISARGLAVLNRLELAVKNGKRDLAMEQELVQWYRAYAENWRKHSKESELSEIGKCLAKVLDTLK